MRQKAQTRRLHGKRVPSLQFQFQTFFAMCLGQFQSNRCTKNIRVIKDLRVKVRGCAARTAVTKKLDNSRADSVSTDTCVCPLILIASSTLISNAEFQEKRLVRNAGDLGSKETMSGS